MSVTVTDVQRTITLMLTPEEAKELRQWMNESRKDNSPNPPYAASLLYGAVSAIADNRGYGGH